MQFLVACVNNIGEYENSFRIVEAESRLAVAKAIVESPDIWSGWLRDSRLYDPIVRGNMPYYADAKPVSAEEALKFIDNSSVDGDSRARMSIHPITEVLKLPLPPPTYSPAK